MGNLTESEEQELKNHLDSNQDDMKVFEDYRLLWEASNPKIPLIPIDVEGDLLKTKRRLGHRKTKIIRFLQQAAAVFILAGFFSSVYIYNYSSTKVLEHIKPPTLVQ